MADLQFIYNCPGCGKPSKTPEGAMTNRCEYCDLVVRIGAPHRILKYFYKPKIKPYGARMAVDRYLKKKGLPLTGNIIKSELFYLPFYRFRGMALDYLAPSVKFEEAPNGQIIQIESKCELKGKDFDVTVPAFSSDEFKLPSLGIRPQSLPLYAFSREETPDDAVMVRSDISPAEVETKAMELHKHNINIYNKSASVCSAMIGEKISVIYFPVWAVTFNSGGEDKTVFVDAVAKRGYTQTEKPFEYKGHISSEKNSHYIQLLKHQCPNCGSDLKENHFSLFYPCTNCNRPYILSDNGYRQVKCLAADPDVCVPYWRFPLEFHGRKSYKTVKDFYNLLTTEVALLRKEKRDNPFYLYSPAFKATDVNLWVKRATAILKTQPHDKLTEKFPKDGPVLCIDEDEAKEMAIFLWRVIAEKYARLQTGEFCPDDDNFQSGEIVWLPIQDFQLIAKSAEFKEVDVID